MHQIFINQPDVVFGQKNPIVFRRAGIVFRVQINYRLAGVLPNVRRIRFGYDVTYVFVFAFAHVHPVIAAFFQPNVVLHEQRVDVGDEHEAQQRYISFRRAGFRQVHVIVPVVTVDARPSDLCGYRRTRFPVTVEQQPVHVHRQDANGETDQ